MERGEKIYYAAWDFGISQHYLSFATEQTLVGWNCHFPGASLIRLVSAGAGGMAEGRLQDRESLKSSRWLELTVLPRAMSLWAGPASLPTALPFLFSISSFSLGMPSHPSCINWVWYWNPPLTAHAHVQPLAVKTSMFSATIMIIAAEHSAKGISKSD